MCVLILVIDVPSQKESPLGLSDFTDNIIFSSLFSLLHFVQS